MSTDIKSSTWPSVGADAQLTCDQARGLRKVASIQVGKYLLVFKKARRRAARDTVALDAQHAADGQDAPGTFDYPTRNVPARDETHLHERGQPRAGTRDRLDACLTHASLCTAPRPSNAALLGRRYSEALPATERRLQCYCSRRANRYESAPRSSVLPLTRRR